MMKRTKDVLRYATLMLTLVTASCDSYPNQPSAFEGSVWPTHTAVDYFNRFHAFTVGNAGLYTLEEMERRTVELIVNAELSIDVALEYFESRRIADALIAAAARGVIVKIVGDVDRRNQVGFQRIESAGLDVVYGDGEITWQAVFGRDLVYRKGEDNLMTHNFVIADRLRIINLTGGFPLDGEDTLPLQAGFIAASEDLVKDFGDCFDQLHGGIFSTAQTFFDDSVSADTNNRTSYAVEDGVMEAYFGPQERLVKEVIDRIYSARSSVRIATIDLRNREMARALRYKAESGFRVEIVLANESVIPLPGLDNIRINPKIDLTMISIDEPPPSVDEMCPPRCSNRNFETKVSCEEAGHEWDDSCGAVEAATPGVGPGTVMVLSMPLFEAVPYYFEDAGEETPLPQPSDRFTDANMWVVEQNVVNPNDDYRNLVTVVDVLYNACAVNERVEANECIPCDVGTTNEVGDNKFGDNTMCDPVLCERNERVEFNKCTPCEEGTTNEAGDDASGDNTMCDAAGE